MGRLEITTAPIAEPITVTEAMRQCRLDALDDATDQAALESELSALIAAARVYCEQYTGRAFVTTGYTYYCEPALAVELPVVPFVALSAVKSFDEDGDETAVSSDSYHLNTVNSHAVVEFDSLPTDAEMLAFVFTAGDGDGSDVPADIRHAMLLLVGQWWRYREAMIATGTVAPEPPFAVSALLNNRRMQWGV